MMTKRAAVTVRVAGLTSALLMGGSLVGCSTTENTSSSCATTRVIGSAHGRQGPSLIAGDELAMKTRVAGGYDLNRMPGSYDRFAGVID